VWARADAAINLPHVTGSVGVGFAGDDNVGVYRSSTLLRMHLRVFPFAGDRFAIGFRDARAIGGSVPERKGGRQSYDVTVTRAFSGYSLAVTAAASRGAPWRYSETQVAYAVAAQLTILSQVDVGTGLGRYRMAYGQAGWEGYGTLSMSVRVGSLRLGTRYTHTRIGLGSGFDLSLGYEPARNLRDSPASRAFPSSGEESLP